MPSQTLCPAAIEAIGSPPASEPQAAPGKPKPPPWKPTKAMTDGGWRLTADLYRRRPILRLEIEPPADPLEGWVIRESEEAYAAIVRTVTPTVEAHATTIKLLSIRLAAARRFSWWLSVKQRAPVRIDLFDSLPGFEPDNNRKHARRAIAPDDLARILEATRSGPEAEGLSGEDRYFLYLVAFATGFRVSELASLKPGDFAIDADVPTIRLAGRNAKNRKTTLAQPLPPGVAHQLAGFLPGKAKAELLWPGKWFEHAARMLRVDLAAANVPYFTEGVNGKEFADFHALRHSFLSALAAANVGPKVLQDLARHSTARLTLEKYTHTDQEQLAGAVGRLSIGGPADPLASLTREQLLLGLGVAAGLLGWLFATPCASGTASKNGDVK